MKVDPSPGRTPSALDRLPVLGICGCSGAGKTTLIEALIPRLTRLGLRLAVVKHGAQYVQIDKPGKDSARFFQAGADVALFGDERFYRWHDGESLPAFLVRLCRSYDLVLLEGHADTPVPKIWLLGEGHIKPPDGLGEIVQVLGWQEAEVDAVLTWIRNWLADRWQRMPVWGCVLIGGRSRRMGRPKHLIEENSITWIESVVGKLEKRVDQVVLSGLGELPASLKRLPRIPDVPGLAGPLAGILSIVRWHSQASWLVAACDLPGIEDEALAWLLQSRRPGIRAILPDLQGDGRVEPLLAYYDFRCLNALEELAAGGSLRISRLVGQAGVVTPQPPVHLHGSWRNVNTLDELAGSFFVKSKQL